MFINGKNLTLTDLSSGKIKEPYINQKFDRNILDVSSIPRFDISNSQKFVSDFVQPIPFIDFTQNLNQPEKVLYIDNKNYPIYNQYKNIYNGGYIFSGLPYQYDKIFENGEYHIRHIEYIFSNIDEDLSSPKISAPNLYTDQKTKALVRRAKKHATNANKRSPKPVTSRLAR